MRPRTLLPALAIGALALTGCSSHDQPAPAVTVTAAPAPEPTTPAPDRTADMTALVVDLSWEQQTEADKDAMCGGIRLYGPGWAAEQMELGAATDVDGIDWDQAAELVAQKCANR
ncbi:hypothetical protein [Streptomyces sp. NPDC001139]